MKQVINVILYQPLYNLLIFLVWLVPNHQIGWAIILLTIIIRLILLPSSLKAAKAQARIQALQPKINEIRRQHKDQLEQSKALMNLYKEEGVSQFGACLPMLIQLPILFVLYQVFRSGLDTSHFSQLYSFVPVPETLNTYFMGINLAQVDPWILPILAGITQYALSVLTMPKISKEDAANADPAQSMMKQMNYIFPVMNFFFGRILPAALVLYWVVTTLFSIGQQLYVNKHIRSLKKPEEKADKVEGKKSVPESKNEKPKKDMLSRMMNKRLDRQEKKSGVSVTIRKKDS